MVDLGLGFSIGGKFEGFLRFLSSQKNQEIGDIFLKIISKKLFMFLLLKLDKKAFKTTKQG